MIRSISGPIVEVDGTNFAAYEMVEIMPKSQDKPLHGEVISISKDSTTIQVYDDTAGLRPGPGTSVTGLKMPVSVNITPGLVGHIFDGVLNPLEDIPEKKWAVTITVKNGQALAPGDIFAEVIDTPLITYKAMIPHDVHGVVKNVVPSGEYLASDIMLTIIHAPPYASTDSIEITLSSTWPIRVPRPIKSRMSLTRPLVTGQRIIDTFFPIAKGGTAAIPGGFGTGKTMTQHQLAKWCDADIIIYIGCGERGNEMTEVLEDFNKLIDPKSGRPLMERTILIANTSDMPVAAREASIYTGVTLAECYRDMGYHVAIMADSTSRFAEALRELSGRLGEIPAEEGYPAYLAARLSAFYGRAGYVTNLNGTEGSISIIGAVSPQGGDFSEPVTQQTKRFVSCYWALDRRLAYARHFPAIDWLTSYSNYVPTLAGYYNNISPNFLKLRERFLQILQEENALLDITTIMGQDTLSESQRQTLALAKEIRTQFLQQNAYDAQDTYMPLLEQYRLMETIIATKKLPNTPQENGSAAFLSSSCEAPLPNGDGQENAERSEQFPDT